jgi:anti-sigma factor RsiW
MTCHYSPTLSSYYDGELSPAQAADVEAHLATCDACAAELRALKRISAVTASAAPVQLSQMGRARILAGLRAGERNRQIMAIARPFAAAASVILAVGLPLLFAAPGQSTPSSATASSGGAPVWEAAMISRDSETVARSTTADQITEWVAADLTVAAR